MTTDLFAEGVKLFNSGQFFEAHDVWEEVWMTDRSPSRRFFQGLIHLAGGFHHYVNGNYRGSANLLASGLRYLRPYAPKHFGVELENLLRRVEECRESIVKLRDGLSNSEEVEVPTIYVRA